jgi:hypothetical protein
MKLLIAAFLVAHALIHASYLAPAPQRTAGGPEWPFEMTRSWLVSALQLDPGMVRIAGTTLVAVTVGLLAVAALAAAGWIVPAAWWPALAASGAVASLATLVLFFHPWILLGVAIDLALLWAVLALGWRPDGITA